MESTTKSNIRALRDEAHLTELCQSQSSFVVLVYSDNCKPCKRLKPCLLNKTNLHAIDLYTIHVDKSNKSSLMNTLQVGKVPHVACFRKGQLKGCIQNSDIRVTWPFIEAHTCTFDIHDDF